MSESLSILDNVMELVSIAEEHQLAGLTRLCEKYVMYGISFFHLADASASPQVPLRESTRCGECDRSSSTRTKEQITGREAKCFSFGVPYLFSFRIWKDISASTL
jgi:hypothetical protein